jgi:hypothetical protein
MRGVGTRCDSSVRSPCLVDVIQAKPGRRLFRGQKEAHKKLLSYFTKHCEKLRWSVFKTTRRPSKDYQSSPGLKALR